MVRLRALQADAAGGAELGVVLDAGRASSPWRHWRAIGISGQIVVSPRTRFDQNGRVVGGFVVDGVFAHRRSAVSMTSRELRLPHLGRCIFGRVARCNCPYLQGRTNMQRLIRSS